MTRLEPWAVGDTPPNVGYRSAVTIAPNTDMETLTACPEAVVTTHVKAAFESVIAILALVGVSLLVLFSFSHSLIDDTIRVR